MTLRDASLGDEGVPLSVAAVARRLGVAPATLRTWDRRYGLGPSEHEPGAHRRYTTDDVTRLVVMRRLTLEGVAPAEAAAAAAAAAPSTHESPMAMPTHDVGSVAAGLPTADRPRTPTPPADQALTAAALAGDQVACVQLIGAAARRRGPMWAWRQVVEPARAAIARRWDLDDPGADADTVVWAATLTALRDLPAVPLRTSSAVLVAAPGHESSTVVLHVVAAAVRADGVRALVMAPGAPREAVAAAARRVGPVALVLLAERLVPDAPAFLASLPRLRTPARLILAGPGWSLTHVPEGRRALHALELESVLDLVAEATAP